MGVSEGGIEIGESPKQTAAREFREETSLTEWSFKEGYERNLSYTYLRKGRKILKTVTYYVVEVHDIESLARSAEHVPDSTGHWCRWGTHEQTMRLLFHAKIRQLFTEADQWIRQGCQGELPMALGNELELPADSETESSASGPTLHDQPEVG